MSVESTAVLLYGFRIPYPQGVDDVDRYFDAALRVANLSQAGVGYAKVGLWDQEKLYLCTAYHEAEAVEARYLSLDHEAEDCARWDGLLNAAARAFGIMHHEPGNWILLVHEA